MVSERRGREGDEERGTLGIDFDPAVARERVAQDAVLLSQRFRVPLGAQLVQQRG